MDIESCYKHPQGRKVTNTTKRYIVKFANRKHSEAMLQQKKDIKLMVNANVFVSRNLCPDHRYP